MRNELDAIESKITSTKGQIETLSQQLRLLEAKRNRLSMGTQLRLVRESDVLEAGERLFAFMSRRPSAEAVAARVALLNRPCTVIDLDAYFVRIIDGSEVAFPGSELATLREILRNTDGILMSLIWATPFSKGGMEELCAAIPDSPELHELYAIKSGEIPNGDVLFIGDFRNPNKQKIASGALDALIKHATKSTNPHVLVWAENRNSIIYSEWLDFLETGNVPGIRLEIKAH